MLSRYVVSQVKHNSYFLVGLGVGLWLALATVPFDEDVVACDAVTLAAPDEYEPQREERPLGSRSQPGRSVQRPRYYSTELGMRSGLLTGVLSSEEVLETRAAALNRTAARLQPALRFFITASALQEAPGRANVVGFTDTREMLKPFHALKYLADNYLEEYDFFFLVSDMSFVNSRRLQELVSKLSVSQDIYMGTVADDDTQYCTLEGGILLSNSVLRAIHSELDWCVRNSYSPHHHENLGRCVLHAAHLSCVSQVQGESYMSVHVNTAGNGVGGILSPALADAVVVQPAIEPSHFHQLLAYISRVYLERAQLSIARERGQAAWSSRHHPRGYRNASWPAALREDAGLATPRPPTRFDHLRWTRFNTTHAFMPDDHRVVAPLTSAYKEAVHLILEEARAWAANRWSAVADAQETDAVSKISPEDISLEEGAWCWEPPVALRYRLLLRLPTRQADGTANPRGALVQVEAARALGAARLAPARYVTESARVTLLLPLPAEHASLAADFLHRYHTVCLQKDTNTALIVVRRHADGDGTASPRLAPRDVTESARVTLLLPLPAEHASLAADFLHRYHTVCLQKDTNTALIVVRRHACVTLVCQADGDGTASPRLAPRDVTESARVTLLLPLPAEHASLATDFLHRYHTVCLQKDTNTALIVVIVPRIEWPKNADNTTVLAIRKTDNSTLQIMRNTVKNFTEKFRNSQIDILEAPDVAVPWGEGRIWSDTEIQKHAARSALSTALPKLQRDALLLLSLPYMEFTEDFLNRVRMNTIRGEQWFLPLPFARYAQFANPLFVDAAGAKPTQNTGRFPTLAAPLVISFYRQDYVAGLESWRTNGGGRDVEAADVLAASPLRCIRAPEPAFLLPPRDAPCTPCNPVPPPQNTTDPAIEAQAACLRRERDRGFPDLQLGARHALAKLLLQTQADVS
ncbi:chondroitin sulfate synthase 2 [Bicyclus anynana]|uniref:Hexosyltransferase n=1 Tax=Bicyclus anynana TaxID=110368 RepID=A0ABM3LQA5_BICAN|nr:chondroitin sulfate synthase 2 [Bicyclus anynana]